MSYKFETTVSFHNNVTHKRRAKNPSFSSILLDAIYRSIDEDHHHHHHRDYPRTTLTSPTRSIIKQQQQQTSETDYCGMESSSKHQQQPRTRTKMRSDSTLETVDLRRAIMIESWMEKQQQRQQQQQKQSLLSSSSSSSSPHFQSQQQHKKHHFHLGDVLVRQKSAPNNRTRLAISSSSENSTTRDFPSSSSSSSCFTNLASSRDQSSSRIFTKTKSRALKIYGDLKRSKQQQNNTPISPGRRIAAFLNSIFRNSGNSPARDSPTEIKLNPPPVMSNSTCSSASSFSRSCLSKTSSSTTKSSSTATTKRSVRFYPVSVIVDEDSRPCGHKSLQKSENEDSKKREKEVDALMMMMKTNCSNNNNINNKNASSFDEEMNDVEDEEDDDDGESCASSDLFELENLSSIGVNHRYYEELPVYGTTSLKNLTTA